MTSPVPYESRVRPLIAAATPAPWGINTLSGMYVVVEDADEEFVAGSVEPPDASLIVTTVNTAAASADLAEAVRAYKNSGPLRAQERFDAMLAALARLDAAGGA